MAESTPCPACGLVTTRAPGINLQEMTRSTPYTSVEVSYVACPYCGLVGKYPLPSEDELKLYYGSSWQYTTPRPGYDRAASFVSRGLFDADGTGTFPVKAGPGMGNTHVVGDRTILDVGSKGSQMAQALARLRWDIDAAEGLDAQPVAPGVSQAWLGTGAGPTGNHSIVCAAHVLEHVLRPDLFMADLANLCAEDGYIYIEVPSLRGGLLDIGLCDDLNRNHLWHFGLNALSLLGSDVGTVVSLETELEHLGWPVDRMLVKKTKPAEESMRAIDILRLDIAAEYAKAASVIVQDDPANTGLYAASHSYAKLVENHPNLLDYRVFDLHKAGHSYKLSRGLQRERIIEPPEMMSSLAFRKVYVTTRSYNSYLDIKRWLTREYPWLLVKTPYAMLAQAVGECD